MAEAVQVNLPRWFVLPIPQNPLGERLTARTPC